MDCIICNWSVENSQGEYWCKPNKQIIKDPNKPCGMFSNDPLDYVTKKANKKNPGIISNNSLLIPGIR